ncbi:hypothetical protein QJS10_CPA01g02864 [Acorus calamus]|uniref:Pectinesterase inhibitor domain-containing protein n=1 Tax=Acorus calamus TaxID=4465 RepID=A0AAV9FMD3_ACOCL|nr:hypothetical protein QJS10_CPA01g02864 [Acorus calamus]
MSPSSKALPLLLLLLLLYQSSANLIRDTCKTGARADPNIKYDFCVRSLESDPRSHNAHDLHGLCEASIDLTIRNATRARARAQELMKKARESVARACLSDCMDLYADAVSKLRDSEKAIRSKRYGDANVWISSAMDAPTTCEDGFREESLRSPLSRENSDVFGLSAITLAITNRLLSWFF